MNSFESGGFNAEGEKDLMVELNELRAQTLPEAAVDKLIDEILEKSSKTEEELFQPAIDNIFRQMTDAGMEPGGFGAYEEAQGLIEDPDFLNTKVLEKSGAKGVYNPLTNKIGLQESSSVFDEPEFYIGELANAGYGENDATAHHELIHSFQHSGENKINLLDAAKNILTFFTEGYRARIILKELQARIGSDRFSQVRTTREHYRAMFDKYKVIKDMADIRKVVTAVEQLKSLYALGLDDKKIGELVGSARWDPETRTFDNLDKEQKVLMKGSGIQKEELKKIILDEDIKSQIYVEKVKIMAQEELKRLHREVVGTD